MKRKNFLLVSFLAMAMTFSVASCSSSSDDPENIPEIPGGGTETPGGGNDNPGGNTELTAAQAKQKLDATEKVIAIAKKDTNRKFFLFILVSSILAYPQEQVFNE